MKDYIEFSGAFDDIVDKIVEECSLEREAVFKILNVLIDNPDLLDRKTEELYSICEDAEVTPCRSGMMIGR